ncbi:MAG TPA: MFS transporter [Solirubrobacteraceae bacterium]
MRPSITTFPPGARPGKRFGRRFGFAAAAFGLAVAMLGTTLPTPLYGLYRQHFGFSELMITVIFATYAAGVIASLLLFGTLSDQIGRRRLLLPGLMLSALSAVCFLTASGLPLLLAGRVLSGLSAGIFTGTATATLIDLAPGGRRGRATLVASMANMGALGSGPLLAGLLSQWAGSPLRLVFWVDLALLLPAAIGIWAMPEPVTRASHLQLAPQALKIPKEMRSTFIEATLAGSAGFAVLGLLTAVTPDFLGQELGVTSRAIVGLVVFAVFAASLAGQLALQFIPERSAIPGGAGALIVGMGALALGLAAPSLALLVLGGMIAGFGQGLTLRGGLTAVNERSPAAERGAVASSFFVVMYIAISVPVIGEGVLAQAVGLRAAGLTFAALVAALSATVLILLARTHRPTAGARAAGRSEAHAPHTA